jgi:hypothetical protein
VPGAFERLQLMGSQSSVAQFQLVQLRIGGRKRAGVYKYAIEKPAGYFGKAAAD